MTRRFSVMYQSSKGWKTLKPRNSQRGATSHQNPSKFNRNTAVPSNKSLLYAVNLSPAKQIVKIRSIEAIQMMRKGASFTRATKTVGLSPRHALPILRPVLYKRKGRWNARRNDEIPRAMRVFTKKGRKVVVVKNSSDRYKVGLHQAEVNRYLYTGNSYGLRNLRNAYIVDHYNQVHILETDPVKIRRMNDSINSPELQELYVDEGW